jgi:hypothetical protein
LIELRVAARLNVARKVQCPIGGKRRWTQSAR